jgi:hypothetical protein
LYKSLLSGPFDKYILSTVEGLRVSGSTNPLMVSLSNHEEQIANV